jgi:hypothetical protein
MAEIKLIFPESRAVIYPAVLRLAEQFDGYSKGPPATLTIQAETLTDKLIAKLTKLWRMAKPLKGAEFILDGKPARKTLHLEMQRIHVCLKEANYAEDIDAYCNGHERKPSDSFGCRQLEGVSTHHKIPHAKTFVHNFGGYRDGLRNPDSGTWNNLSPPFSLFASQTENGWTIDTDRIKKRLRKFAEGASCNLCPHFSWERINQSVDVKAMTAVPMFNTMTDDDIFGKFTDEDESND